MKILATLIEQTVTTRGRLVEDDTPTDQPVVAPKASNVLTLPKLVKIPMSYAVWKKILMDHGIPKNAIRRGEEDQAAMTVTVPEVYAERAQSVVASPFGEYAKLATESKVTEAIQKTVPPGMTPELTAGVMRTIASALQDIERDIPYMDAKLQRGVQSALGGVKDAFSEAFAQYPGFDKAMFDEGVANADMSAINSETTIDDAMKNRDLGEDTRSRSTKGAVEWSSLYSGQKFMLHDPRRPNGDTRVFEYLGNGEFITPDGHRDRFRRGFNGLGTTPVWVVK